MVAWGYQGAGSVEPLIDALKDSDGKVRMLAASALGDIKDPRAVEQLIFVYRARTNTPVGQRQALLAISEMRERLSL